MLCDWVPGLTLTLGRCALSMTAQGALGPPVPDRDPVSAALPCVIPDERAIWNLSFLI